jgi:hypothetical protein
MIIDDVTYFEAVLLWIRDILVQIGIWFHIRGSVPLCYGSGSGSCPFSSVAFKMRTKNKFFCLLLFEGTFASDFKNKKSQNSRNQGFLFFAG